MTLISVIANTVKQSIYLVEQGERWITSPSARNDGGGRNDFYSVIANAVKQSIYPVVQDEEWITSPSPSARNDGGGSQ